MNSVSRRQVDVPSSSASGGGGQQGKQQPACRRVIPVEIEASVLIKIMKHCREYFPTPVNGLIMGLNTSTAVEVTDCFGCQVKRDLVNQLLREKVDSRDVDEKVHLEDHRYQLKMLEQLHLVHADPSTVGWYQTLQFSDLTDLSVIDGLCEHQEFARDAVVIGFDPQLSDLGAGAFKAFRLPDAVLQARREAEKNIGGAWARLSGQDLLVEVPMYVRNSLLIQAFLVDWLQRDRALQRAGEFDALELGDRAGMVQQGLGFIISCLDDLQLEQDKLMKTQKDAVRQSQRNREFIERRRLENEQRRLRNEELLPEIPLSAKRMEVPSQLPTLLMTNHVHRVSNAVTGVIQDNLGRSLLLHKEVS